MPANHVSRAEYLKTFRELRGKEPLERTDKYYASVIAEVVMAVYGDRAITGDLADELKGFLERPYGNCSQTEKSAKTDSVLDKIIRDLGTKEANAGENKYSVANLEAPAMPKPEVGTVKINNLDKSWIGRQVKIYGEGLPEEGFEGIGCKKGRDLYVKGTGQYVGMMQKLKPGYLLEKRHNTFHSAWHPKILIE